MYFERAPGPNMAAQVVRKWIGFLGFVSLFHPGTQAEAEAVKKLWHTMIQSHFKRHEFPDGSVLLEVFIRNGSLLWR